MEYNLTDKQRSVITWMVEANRRGELEEEFFVMWVMGSPQAILVNSSGGNQIEPGDEPEITRGVLDRLASEGLIEQEIRYETKINRSGTQRQSERSRSCSLTRRAYEAVDANFVLPEPQPTAASFHFYGDVSQSIVGTQNRAELTNNMDFGSVREQIDREGGDDREELHLALDYLERLVERGEYLDRGSLSRFSKLMERHSWFTNAVMSALLGFATQIVTS